MANRNAVGPFVNSFMAGYSFVDDIQSRKRQETMLAARLEEENKDRETQRKIQQQFLAERGQDRAFMHQDRIEADRLKKEDREINEIFARNLNPSEEELKPYEHTQRVVDYRRSRMLDAQRRGDAETIAHGSGFDEYEEEAALGPDGQPINSATQQLNFQNIQPLVPKAELPGHIATNGQPITTAELNKVAMTQGFEAAQALRDERGPRPGDEEIAARGRGGQRGSGGGRQLTVGEKRQLDEQTKRNAEAQDVKEQWRQLSNINDPRGDALRALDPNILTAKYFRERSTITDPKEQQRADDMMRSAIDTTIQIQHDIIRNTPGDHYNHIAARRKVSEAYGLAQTIQIEYSPLLTAGVDDRGLPIGGNEVLTDAVLAAAFAAPAGVLPLNPEMVRADMAMINRGAKRRINTKFDTAVFREYKNGSYTWDEYQSLIKTGKLPPTPMAIKSHDPYDAMYAHGVDQNGNPVHKLIVPAIPRPGDRGKGNNDGRNVLDGAGDKLINDAAKSLNTDDYPQRGFAIVNEFKAFLNANEQMVTLNRYDLSNQTDVAALWQRWVDKAVVRDRVNDEFWFQGRWRPDYDKVYGPVSKNFFEDEEQFTEEEFEELELGPSPVHPLKSRPRLGNPAVYEQIRLTNPGMFGGMNDDEIEEELALQYFEGR